MLLPRFTLPALLCLYLTSCTVFYDSRPATIEMKDASTIYFKGNINSGDETRFADLLTPAVKRVVINSGGGEVTTGMKIGKLIYQHGLSVEVEDLCGSSCANYIFTAGREKIVPKGAFVGFHGDPQNSPAVQLFRFIYAFNPKVREYSAQSRKLTDEFYALIGINPKIYAYSAQFTMANNVTFWVPSPRELECMNVQGLNMWFSDHSRDFTNQQRVNVRTSAEDVRNPHPDICQ